MLIVVIINIYNTRNKDQLKSGTSTLVVDLTMDLQT